MQLTTKFMPCDCGGREKELRSRVYVSVIKGYIHPRELNLLRGRISWRFGETAGHMIDAGRLILPSDLSVSGARCRR